MRLRALADDDSVARATDTPFSLWLKDAGIEDAQCFARRALDALVTPCREADISLDTAPAVGIALSPIHGRDAGALLRRAEVPLIAATGAENPIVVYDPTTDPRRPADRLAAHAVDAHSVVFELIESAVMNEPESAIRVFGRLADRGVDLAIDDFGIGQSSFAYLRRLPVREIKIDRLFTQSLSLDSSDRELVRSMVELGHRLGYRVTAGGVETVHAPEYLRTIGCDHVRGYHIAKAMAPDAVEVLLRRMEAENAARGSV